MSLVDLARSDLKSIMNDSTTAFGWPFEIVSPSGTRYAVTGRLKEIHLAEDADTGESFSLQQATASYWTDDVAEVVKASETPPFWTVEAVLPSGKTVTYAVVDTMPTEVLGNTVLKLKAVLE